MSIRIGSLFCTGCVLLYGSAVAQPVSTSFPVEQVKVQKEIEGGQLRPNTAPLELISKGETLYSRRCAACHSIDANRVGPMHRGVYGRAAGGVPGFRYSRALKALDLTWTEDTLDKWLTNPTSVAPGTSMGFRLRKPEERKAIIAYLISISDPAENDPVNEPAEK